MRAIGLLLATLVAAGCGSSEPAGNPVSPAMLTTTTAVAASASCPNGGVKLQAGLDDGAKGGVAGDGVLQPGEVRSTTTQCNPYCGDAVTDAEYGEACDDGAKNGTAGDSCSASCQAVVDCGAYPTPAGCPAVDYAIRTVSAPSATTAGGFEITLGGTFPTSGAVQVTMAGAAITPSTADASSVVFVAPAGVGSAPITLTVGGTVVPFADATVSSTGVYQQVIQDQAPFTYPAPTVSAVAGCATDSGSSTADCPTAGGTQVTITGTGFGASSAGISVTVGGLSCGGVSLVAPQTELQCTLPAGGGFDLPVVVTVAGTPAAVAGPTVSYVGPEITSVPSPPTAAVGGETITLDGNFPGAGAATSVTLYAGEVAEPCGNVQAVSASELTCVLPAGGGANLDVVVGINGISSRRFASGIAYAPPAITAGTLRDMPGASGSTSLILTSNDPQVLYFDAVNLGPDPSQVQVFYGQPANPRAHRCSTVSFVSGGLSCATERGNDSGNVFVVSAYGQESQPGSDTLSFPAMPMVTAIRGCVDHPPGTGRCPTVGGLSVQVTLSYMATAVPVLEVDGRDCAAAHWISSSDFVCSLPPGGGEPRLDVRFGGESLALGDGVTLDYALPIINRVSGCQDVDITTIACAAGDVVSVEGQGFGPSGDVVLVGGQPCASLAHDPVTPDSKLLCTLPAGSGMNQEVRVLDVSGRSSNVVHLSYGS